MSYSYFNNAGANSSFSTSFPEYAANSIIATKSAVTVASRDRRKGDSRTLMLGSSLKRKYIPVLRSTFSTFRSLKEPADTAAENCYDSSHLDSKSFSELCSSQERERREIRGFVPPPERRRRTVRSQTRGIYYHEHVPTEGELYDSARGRREAMNPVVFALGDKKERLERAGIELRRKKLRIRIAKG